MASPSLTATTEASRCGAATSLVALVLIDKARPRRASRLGETRLHGVGSDNPPHSFDCAPTATWEITAKSARAIRPPRRAAVTSCFQSTATPG